MERILQEYEHEINFNRKQEIEGEKASSGE